MQQGLWGTLVIQTHTEISKTLMSSLLVCSSSKGKFTQKTVFSIADR